MNDREAEIYIRDLIGGKDAPANNLPYDFTKGDIKFQVKNSNAHPTENSGPYLKYHWERFYGRHHKPQHQYNYLVLVGECPESIHIFCISYDKLIWIMKPGEDSIQCSPFSFKRLRPYLHTESQLTQRFP